MKITAVIPAYNSALHITRALDSIAGQTRPVSEIIVVDDGSTDGTAHAVANWNGPLQVRLLKQANQGPSVARNRGVEAALGDWIAFLDADDSWTPDHLSDHLANLKKHPQLALLAADMAEVDTQGNILVPSALAAHRLLAGFEALDGAPIPRALARLLEKNFIPTGTVLVRRKTLLEAGLFDTRIRYGEDLELWARIAAHHPIACLPRVHMFRTRHQNNASTHTLPMLMDLVEVNRQLRERIGNRLRNQGLDPDRLVADALWTAGYQHFIQGRHAPARALFLASLREARSLRTLRSLALSLLPPSLAMWLRRFKL